MPPAGQIKAVVFDLGRVLIQWDMRCLFAKLIDDQAELDWFLDNVVTQEWHFQHDAGRPLDEMVPERKAQFPDHAHLIEAYRHRFLETIPGRVPGTDELLLELKSRGTPLFALTNFGAEFWDQFRPTEPLLDHFEDILVSGQEKLAKPDPAIYALAEQRFGHSGSDIFFIDDSEPNVASARAFGWQAHHFEGAEGLESELRQRNLI